MRIVETYSHLNGVEYLMVNRPQLWVEVQQAIKDVDAQACKDKISKEKRKMGKRLFSPKSLNAAFKKNFEAAGWKMERYDFWVTSNERVLRDIQGKTPAEQEAAILEANCVPIATHNQTDFLKDRVAVEVQFGKYSFVAHDMFVKHMSFFAADYIDVGIEILPMKELEEQMSSGVAYYERDLLNIIRQGRTSPAVPIVLMGVAP